MPGMSEYYHIYTLVFAQYYMQCLGGQFFVLLALSVPILVNSQFYMIDKNNKCVTYLLHTTCHVFIMLQKSKEQTNKWDYYVCLVPDIMMNKSLKLTTEICN